MTEARPRFSAWVVVSWRTHLEESLGCSAFLFLALAAALGLARLAFAAWRALASFWPCRRVVRIADKVLKIHINPAIGSLKEALQRNFKNKKKR